MKREALLAALLGVILAGAAGLRLTSLANRPMHGDEAVGAVKFGRLLEHGQYVYDPTEYHGPSLNYFTLPVAAAASASELTQVTETQLRLVPALFGLVLVGLVWLIRDELGRPAALWAASLTAVSPAMVFYSRYYIQEMLLVCFTFGAIVALVRLDRVAGGLSRFSRRENGTVPFPNPAASRSRLRPALWLVLLGVSVGMMHASKETCVIPLVALAVGALMTMARLRGVGARRVVLSGMLVALVAAGVSALFFSSFLGNPQGVVDSVKAYSHYLARASGEGTAGSHDYPWYHYFRILFWWRHGAGPVWTEAAVAVLALVGLAAAASARGLAAERLPTARLLAIYTLVTTVIYCALPYKTPWSLLGFYHGIILVAGVGASVLVRAARGNVLKALTVAVLIAAAGHLTWQARRAAFVACDGPGNPFAYAHTTRDVPRFAQRMRTIAASHPQGKGLPVQVVCPDGDYWPLPWYLRDFTRIGWYDRVPQGPPAPLIVAQPEMEPALLEYLYVEPPPGQRPLYVPLPPETGQQDWRLRPNVPLRAYVRLDLWQACQRQRR